MDNGKRVGVIGLGIMGGSIARNLDQAGYRVTGYDIDAARRRELAEAGLDIVEQASEVAVDVKTILISLPNERALEDTVQALVSVNTPQRIVIETSTLPLTSKEAAESVLRAAGHVMLDCPLSGTGAQARTKDLVVYASGDTAAIAASGAVFSGFARAYFDVGAFGNGSRMKYVANLLVFVHNIAAAEAIVLGMKSGLDPHKLIEVISAGAGGSRMLEVRGPMMADARYENVTANYATYYKDLKIIGEFAMSLDCPTPLLSASLPIYLAGRASYDKLDVASVCTVLEAMAGVKRGG